jgi:hypothetical protein
MKLSADDLIDGLGLTFVLAVSFGIPLYKIFDFLVEPYWTRRGKPRP